jgi:hypothetical protein
VQKDGIENMFFYRQINPTTQALQTMQTIYTQAVGQACSSNKPISTEEAAKLANLATAAGLTAAGKVDRYV